MHFGQSDSLLFKLRYYGERRQSWPWGKQHRPFQKIGKDRLLPKTSDNKIRQFH